MRESDERSTARRWPWIILLIAAATTAILAFGVWSGHCIDTPVESSAASTCISGPTIGWTGAWIVLALCIAHHRRIDIASHAAKKSAVARRFLLATRKPLRPTDRAASRRASTPHIEHNR